MQVLPEQQVCPAAPQLPQVLDVPHPRPGLHALPAQHRWPLAPQATQLPALQASVALLHALPAQQTCPSLPQSDTWQRLDRHTSPDPQVLATPQQG